MHVKSLILLGVSPWLINNAQQQATIPPSLSSSPNVVIRNSVELVAQDRLFTLFKNTCETGSGRLKAEEATPLSSKEIPRMLRDWWQDTKNVKFYRLIASKPSYLVVFEGYGSGDKYLGGCALVTEVHGFRELFEAAVGHDVAKVLSKPNITKIQYVSAIEKFNITAQKIGEKFNILQVSLLNSRQAELEQKDFEKSIKKYKNLRPSKIVPLGVTELVK